MLRNYLDQLYIKTLVEAAVVGATNAGTTGVDMKTCRSGVLVISYTDGSDTVTEVDLETSDDDSTYADLVEGTNSDFTATGLILAQVDNMKRYNRISWTRSGSVGDNYWAIILVGFEAIKKPVS